MRLLSYFLPFAPLRLVYMLQQVEYDSFKFADWVDNVPNLFQVQTRQKLDLTLRAKFTTFMSYLLWGIPFVAGLVLAYSMRAPLWLIVSAFAPLFNVIGLFIVNGLFGLIIVHPTQRKEIAKALKKLAPMPALRIAVIGSYGKTSMKDILATVLGEGKKVAATPGNKNVLISHARWVLHELDGDEEVLIFEYGEAVPGDISLLSGFSQPTHAVLTGLAPAHMEGYGTLKAIADDFATITDVVSSQNLFVNADSADLVQNLTVGIPYSAHEVDDWKVHNVSVTLTGVSFGLKKGKRSLKLTSGLLGVHNIGPLAAVAAIAARLGLSDKQIEAGIAKTKPFEHRMQPYHLGGALIIDDTYNGNIDGMKAGLSLLKAMPAKRKMYVTPGLVEQGELTEAVHHALGVAIAEAQPDKVVLMRNSTTAFIQQGLEVGGFAGELQIEDKPLDFYTNLEHFVARGDVVLLQNDWTDNYS